MRSWPEDVVTWLRENVPGRTSKEVVEIINQQGYDRKYGMTFTEAMIKSAKNRYGIKSGTPGGVPKGTSLKYPEGMEEYVRSVAPGRKTEEIAEMTSAHFGIEFSASQCRAYKRNHNIVSGVDCRFRPGQEPPNKGKPMSREQYKKCKATMFKKGQIPKNHMEVGEYTHTTDGYLIRKVQEKGTQMERFEFVHRAVWEEHNGPIPAGKIVSFLDGNKDNCNIENLFLTDGQVNLELNRRKLRFENPEFTKAGIAVVKLRIAARNRKEEK